MSHGPINAVLSSQDRTAIMDAIATIHAKLPFLVDLSLEERRTLPKMGDKTRAFVSQALTVATQNIEHMPRSFDLESLRMDVELAQALEPVLAAVAQLYELLDDTYLAVGSEAYVSALSVYTYAKAAGKGGGMDSMRETLGKRFTRKGRETTPTI